MNNKKKWITWTVVIIILTNIATFIFSNTVSLYLPNGNVIVNRQQFNDYLKFQKMFTVRDQLYKYYDGTIKDSDLVEGAIKGMTSALNDPYTVFMNKKEYQDFNAQTEGNYSGVGLQIQNKDDKIQVVSVFEGSPSKAAGVLPKDVIQKVNGTQVTGKDLEKAVSLMKGTEGTSVSISLYREGKGTFTVSMKRAKINMVTVNGEILQNGIAYIQVTMFDQNTAKNFLSKLNELKGKGMKGLILDLRGNPGGLLDECVDMASNFIAKDKVIVSTIDKNNNKTNYKSKGGNYIGLTIVVLTDEGTASASEIFSGAVRDYKLGTLVGTKTFGKGIVQTLLDTGEGTALKVTVSKYYTPNGENIHHIGIKPDVEVSYPDALRAKAYDRNTDPQFKKALEIINQKLGK